MQVYEAPAAAPKNGTAVRGTHQVEFELAPHVAWVRTGTPVVPGPHGWAIAQPDEAPVCYAANAKNGGDKLNGWRAMTLDTGAALFLPGARYRIEGVQDNGQPVFVEEELGPYPAISQTAILLDATEMMAWLRAAKSPSPQCAPARAATKEEV